MVTYDPVRVAAAAVVLTLAVQHVPRLLRAFWRFGVLKSLKQLFARLYMRTPGMRKKLLEGEKKLRERIQAHLLKHRESATRALPAAGISSTEVIEKLKAMATRDKKLWGGGKVSGAVYFDGEELGKLITSAMEMFLAANPLHPSLFPAIRQMESEIVQMTVDLFHGDTEVRGVLTSGGTESLLMMMYAYREWGLHEKGITSPEIVAPRSVHAALSKGANYFGVRVIYVDVDEMTMQASVAAMEAAISSQTIALVCSVPCFPHGVIDPVQALADLAVRKGINLHVDCSIGGFLVPFMSDAGFPIPRFDFLLSGVSSISCDPHRFGCTPKGVSVLLYRTAKLRSYQYFMEMEWSGGLYFTPCFAGSRNGAVSAGAWATLVHFGREGYVNHARDIVSAARRIRERSGELPDLRVVGDPLTCIVAFKSETLNVHAVSDVMHSEFGWTLSNLQSPPAFHICVTKANCEKADEFIRDLKSAVTIVKGMKDVSKCDVASVYALAESLPDRSYLKCVGDAYLDCLFMA